METTKVWMPYEEYLFQKAWENVATHKIFAESFWGVDLGPVTQKEVAEELIKLKNKNNGQK